MSKETAITRTEKLIKGENPTEVAKEIVEDAKHALEIQKSLQSGKVADQKKIIKNLEKELENTILNKGTQITDRDTYFMNLVSINERLNNANEVMTNLEKIDAIIKYGIGRLEN